MSAELAERPKEMSTGTTGAWTKVGARTSSTVPGTTKAPVTRPYFSQVTGAEAVGVRQPAYSDINDATPSYDDEKYQSFIKQRAVLIRKKLISGLDRKEVLELRMIEWAIDRAELAAHDGSLRALERVAEMQEKLVKQINALNRTR